MASRFVSGGTIAGDGHGEASQPSAGAQNTNTGAREWDKETSNSTSNTEWEAVQRDLDADRRRREEARRAQVEGGAAAGGGERSLYEVLQANKAAKQAAFEEQTRLRNQFRSLDDDEIEFLDGVLEERRAEEERVKRETEERLERFRRAQKGAGGAASPAEDLEDDGTGNGGEGEGAVAWGGGGKKRKRGDKENGSRGVVKGVKRRASEHEHEKEGQTAETKPAGIKPETKSTSSVTNADSTPKPPAVTTQASPLAAGAPQQKPKPQLGLVDYGSDEDDDD